MTERDLGNSISWWIGEVVNVKDPDQSGRVQVRVYSRHDDKTNIPDADLPWALPLQPVTSAAYGKVGTAPLGLVKGSKIMGFWMDRDQQYPVIWGSFGKAGDPIPGNSQGGTEKIDTKKGSIPNGTQNHSAPSENDPFLKNNVIDKVNSGKLTLADLTVTSGKIPKNDFDNKAKEPKKPTTASAKKDEKSDVLDVIKKVDPDKLSRALPNMVDGFTSVRNIMSMTSPAGLTNLLSGGIQGMIQGLAGKIGLGGAMGLMNGLAASGVLSGVAQNALQQAVASTALSAVRNNGIPLVNTLVSEVIPQIDPAIGIPLANLIKIPGPTFVQQYYPIDKEPYPGYIQFIDVATKEICYKLRGNEPHYESAQAHIQANASHNMLSQMGALVTSGKLNSAIQTAAAVTNITGAASEIAGQLGATGVADVLGTVNNIAGNATGAIANIAGGNILGAVQLSANVASSLGGIISGGLGIASAQGIASVLGNGVNLGNITSLASKLLPGGLAGGIQGLMNGHLPNSVLDVGKIGQAMGEFTKNQAILAIKKKEMKKALDPDKAGSDLSKLSDATKAAKSLVTDATGMSGLDAAFQGSQAVNTAAALSVGPTGAAADAAAAYASSPIAGY